MRTFFKLLFRLFLLLVTGMLGLAALAYWRFRHPLPTHGLDYIQGVTGVQFPPGITQYVAHDNAETFITAHLTIPPAEIQPFILRQRFSISPQAAQQLRGVSSLPLPFNIVPASANYALVGRSARNAWTFVLDSRSGDLWATVEYPDAQGDPP
jgi:hypothetical protein